MSSAAVRVGRSTTLVMPRPYRGSSASSSGVSRRGVSPARCSAGQNRVAGPAEGGTAGRRQQRRVDADEQDVETGCDLVAQRLALLLHAGQSRPVSVAAMTTDLLRAEGLQVGYGEVPVCAPVDLALPTGRALAV